MTLKYEKSSESTLLLLTTINLRVIDILDAKIKQKELANKSDISNIVENFDLNAKLTSLATKAGLKAEQDKIVNLQIFDLSYFLGKNFSGDDGFQNMFIYKSTLDTLELKKDTGTDYVFSWK